MREMKFQTIHKEYKSGKCFIGEEWGPIKGGFKSPSSYSHAECIGHREYTGRNDKDGIEIYEGDICSTYNIDEPSNLVDTVVFEDGSFMFQNDYKLSAELRGFKSDYIEVIGNIYEHPHLLK